MGGYLTFHLLILFIMVDVQAPLAEVMGYMSDCQNVSAWWYYSPFRLFSVPHDDDIDPQLSTNLKEGHFGPVGRQNSSSKNH